MKTFFESVGVYSKYSQRILATDYKFYVLCSWDFAKVLDQTGGAEETEDDAKTEEDIAESDDEANDSDSEEP